MGKVRPFELTAGMARNQSVIGRVRMLDSQPIEKAGKQTEHTELHLIAEEGLSGALFVEAWREQSRRLAPLAKEGKSLKLTNLTIKAMGEKAQWQCSNLENFGQVSASTRIEQLEDDDAYPANLHTVLLGDLPMHKSISHQVHVAAVFLEAQQPATTKITAPSYNLVLGDGTKSVRVAVWKDHANKIGVNRLEAEQKNKAIILTSLKVTKGKDDTTELSSSRRTEVLQPSPAQAATLQMRTRPQSELASMSRTPGHTDYSKVKATAIHLQALMSLIVPQEQRDFNGEVFEVFHVVVEDVEPVPDADDLFYHGCPVCRKKRGPESTCRHVEELVPFFLGQCSMFTFEGRAQARVIGQVLENMLGVTPAECVPDKEGFSVNLATALDTLRGTPYNMRFTIGSLPNGTKNVLELVHVSPSLDVSTGIAKVPSHPWRLIEGDASGVPPCSINSLSAQQQFKMLRGKPVTNIQVLLCITDSGEEHGNLEQDDGLVRLKRKASCCISGNPVKICRTGDLSSMGKYLRWERKSVIFCIVRVLDIENDVPILAIRGSKTFSSPEEAMVFNAYFTRYVDLTASISDLTPFPLDNASTPKRRRQAYRDDPESNSQLTPQTFPATPLTHTSN